MGGGATQQVLLAATVASYARTWPAADTWKVLQILKAWLNLLLSASGRVRRVSWLWNMAAGSGKGSVWSITHSMKASCRTRCAAFLRLKLMWVMGVSRSNHRRCSPCLSSARLHGVYSFCSRENSKTCNTHVVDVWLVSMLAGS